MDVEWGIWSAPLGSTAGSKKIEAFDCRPQRGLTIDPLSIFLIFAILVHNCDFDEGWVVWKGLLPSKLPRPPE